MKTGIIITFIVIVLIAGGFYFYNQTSGKIFASNNIVNNVANNVVSSDVRIIEVNASRFAYSPDVIKVKRGEHVRIVINNEDTTHGISIPDLNVNGIGSVEFTADKIGTFEFRCPTFCGEGHKEMTGTLIVE